MISAWKQQRASQRSPGSFVCLCAFIYLKIPIEILCCCLFYFHKNINEGSNMFLVALTAQKWRQKAIIMVFVRCWPHPSHDSVPLSIRRKKKNTGQHMAFSPLFVSHVAWFPVTFMVLFHLYLQPFTRLYLYIYFPNWKFSAPPFVSALLAIADQIYTQKNTLNY